MAAPELQNTTPVAGESAEPAANPETAPAAALTPAADDDSRWFEDFERVEKVFYIIAPFMFVSALVAYVGLHLEIYPVFIVAVVVLRRDDGGNVGFDNASGLGVPQRIPALAASAGCRWRS